MQQASLNSTSLRTYARLVRGPKWERGRTERQVSIKVRVPEQRAEDATAFCRSTRPRSRVNRLTLAPTSTPAAVFCSPLLPPKSLAALVPTRQACNPSPPRPLTECSLPCARAFSSPLQHIRAPRRRFRPTSLSLSLSLPPFVCCPSMLAGLLFLAPLALASPLYKRQDTSASAASSRRPPHPLSLPRSRLASKGRPASSILTCISSSCSLP